MRVNFDNYGRKIDEFGTPRPDGRPNAASAVRGAQDLSDRQIRRRHPGEAGLADQEIRRGTGGTRRGYVRFYVRGARSRIGGAANRIEPANRGGGCDRGEESRSDDRAGESRGDSRGRRSARRSRLPLDFGGSRSLDLAAIY